MEDDISGVALVVVGWRAALADAGVHHNNALKRYVPHYSAITGEYHCARLLPLLMRRKNRDRQYIASKSMTGVLAWDVLREG